jgi:hypothetical protein
VESSKWSKGSDIAAVCVVTLPSQNEEQENSGTFRLVAASYNGNYISIAGSFLQQNLKTARLRNVVLRSLLTSARENSLHRLFQIIALAFLILCRLSVAPAQDPRPESSDVLKQLLSQPAPTPREVEEVAAANKEPRQRSAHFFDEDAMPPDGAPAEDLVDYWLRWASNYRRPQPSATVQRRLLDECSADPELLPRLLPAIPATEANAARVKELYDRAQSEQQLNQSALEAVKKWLVFNSKYFLNELLTMANKTRDNEKYGSVDKEEALVALAQIDWPSAAPLVQSLANGSQPRAAALALSLLYKQAITAKDLSAEEKFRAQLQTIVSDKNAVARARDKAIEVLSLTQWSGRDDWYLSLFQDETLIDLSEGSTGFSPLTTLFATDPEKWIPVMAKLVESKDRTVRSGAASCLITFQNQRAREDALRPLLPWLSNPAWADNRGDHRLRLIQSMENLNLPESVPGLIWAVEHDDSEWGSDRSYAAESLAKYKDPRAVPALKKALTVEKDESDRERIIKGLLACGGLTETEQLDALEAYAAKLATPGGREDVDGYRSRDEPLELPLSIGRYVAKWGTASESLVRAVLARAEILKKANPTLAESLLQVAHRWQGRQVDLDMVQRLGDGSADADTIIKALERREKLRESVGPELQALAAATDLAQGIAPVLLEDASLAQSVLSSGREPSQIALLACARLVQMPLPVETVGVLLQSQNQLLAFAAERYLLVEDSKEARELLWSHHPREAFVTGWRDNIQLMNGNNFDVMGKVEEQLRTELFKENPPVETIALVTNSEFYSRVLRVYADRAVYTYYENEARYLERVITKEELSAFRQFLTTNDFANQGPQFFPCHHECWTAELLIISREKGRRVFTEQGFNGWTVLIENLEQLGQGENAKIHYNLEKEIKGLEVLYADPALVVRDVWQDAHGIRIFVERDETAEEASEREKSYSSDEQDDETTRAELRRRQVERVRARFSWRALVNDKAGAVTAAPAEFSTFSTFDESKFPSDDDLSGEQSSLQFLTPDSVIIARNFDGLWRQVAGRKAVRISEGAYLNPVVTPDGKWVVVAKADSHWGEPNYVVRFNLQTGREFRVNIPPAEDFAPIAYVAPHGRVLIRRARDSYQPSPKSVGPEVPEYYLLDATTGKAELVTGVFEPLRQEGKRLLQSTGKPNEFWVAIPDRTANQTRVGRYNLKDFSFQPVLVVPHIAFDSMSMWVDEAGAKLLVVYEAQLLRLPLLLTVKLGDTVR